MTLTTPRIRTLLRQADRVADAGKRSAAEKLYRQIIEEAPDTAAAWAGLGEVLRSAPDKESSYRHALELDPDNNKARTGLAYLAGEDIPVNQGNRVADPDVLTDISESQVDQGKEGLISLDPDTEAETVAEQAESDNSQPADNHNHLGIKAVANDGVLYCANHTNRETHLRCNRCNKPICSSCAKRTPVGYRCPECIREQEDTFYSATVLDYFLAVIVAFPLSLIAGSIATFLGIFSIFLGAAAGSLIGRLALRAAGRRRGRWMPQIIGAIVVLGAIIGWFVFSAQISFRLIFIGIYIVTATGAAYYQMR